jgi:hypothetical protein
MFGEWGRNCEIDSSSGSEFATDVVEQQSAQEAGKIDRRERQKIPLPSEHEIVGAVNVMGSIS